MTDEILNLYPEAKTALVVLFIADYKPILRELHIFGTEHLSFLKNEGLIDDTMEVITKKGLPYIELFKEELSNLEIGTVDPDIIELEKYLGSHLKTYLLTIYLLGKAPNPPSVIFTPDSYLDILATEFNLLTEFEYKLNDNGYQVLYLIGKRMIIRKDKAQIQQIVDELSDWQALTLYSVSERANHHKTTMPYHINLVQKGLITENYESITKKGIRVLIRYNELHTRKLWKLLNHS